MDSSSEFVYSENSMDEGSEGVMTDTSMTDTSMTDTSMTDTSMNPDPEKEIDESHSYEVLSTNKIVTDMKNSMKEVQDVLESSETVARMLLKHFKWDRVKLMERYFDGDEKKFFAEAHLVINGESSQNLLPKTSMPDFENNTEDCTICISTVLSNSMIGLKCGHRFCLNCWTNYVTEQMTDYYERDAISCIEPECQMHINEETVMNLVKDLNFQNEKYQRFISNNYVKCNKNFRWCPSPACNSVIKVQEINIRGVTCKCGYIFCFFCGHDWHDPIRCDLLPIWKEKCYEDPGMCQRITYQTKNCPKCLQSMEKTNGCNQMICANNECQKWICWICTPWEDSHKLDRYNRYRYKIGDKMSPEDQVRDRYMHYCVRYLNHEQSLKFDKELYGKVNDMLKHLQWNCNISGVEVQLRKAIDILCDCRQVLMYSYAFGYFLVKTSSGETLVMLFEDMQTHLENATEVLSGYLEKDMLMEDPHDLEQKIQDKYRYCEDRKKKLLEHVHEGYKRDWWIFLY